MDPTTPNPNQPQDTLQIQGLPPGVTLRPVQSQPITTKQSIPGLPPGVTLRPIANPAQSTGTVQPSTTNLGGQTDQSSSAAKHGLLHRAWDWVNTPVFDNILPHDVKTSDIVKAAAFEKMYGEAYIPGFNDFDTKAQLHLGDSPTKAAVRAFINGTAKDTASTAAGFTSPVGVATIAAGGAGKLPGAVGQVARAVGPLAGTAFGLQGVHDVYQAGTENTPEAWQQRLQGGAMIAGGTAAAGEGLSAVRTAVADNLARRVSPVTKTVAGQEIPVRAETRMGRFAAKAVDPDVVAKAAEKTAGAIQTGVSEVAKQAAGSKAETSIKGEDRFGLRGHANDLIENQARPLFKALDELSGGEFTKAQKAEKAARRIGDFDKMNEAATKQDELTEQFRDKLNERGLDPDEAWGNYRKGVALQKIASQFDTATGPKEAGLGYQVKGDKLAAAIDRVRRSAPERNLFKKAGFTDTHIDALAELADTLRNEQNIPQFSGYQRFAAKAIAGAVGFGHSGVLGLAEALTGESAAESLLRKGATSLLGQAMMSEPATRELTDALKSGDANKGVAAVQNMAKENPAWWSGLKNTMVRLWREEQGTAGAPGTVGDTDQLAPAFFSKAEQVANQKVSTGSGDSILAALRNNGVKESEIQWLGLDDYLKGNAKVSKSDLQQYINEHKIALNETNLGGDDRKHVRDLTVQRNKVYAENNRLWADHMRYANGASELFNAMKEGKDVEPIVATMSDEVQGPARRFVETDQEIRDLDNRITEAERTTNKPAKYEQYTLPGEKSNYTEKLLTLAGQGNLAELKAQLARAEEDRTHYLQTLRPVPGNVELRFQDAQKAVRQAINKSNSFQSSHFDEPNILAHVRYDDRSSVDGKKTLFLEELQSDWHQKGKRQGYRTDTMSNLAKRVDRAYSDYQDAMATWNSLGDKSDRVSPEWKSLPEADRQLSEAKLAYNRGQNSVVPDAPFKTDWHELAMKRMLRHAAENGYDRLAWTTGDQQAARYDLSRQVSKLEWHPVIGSQDGRLAALDHDGNIVMHQQMSPSQVADYVGKDAAEKLLNAPLEHSETGRRQWRSISGVDLKVGGDWAKALYDRAIPNFLNKYAKKWGAKVGETQLRDAVGVNERFDLTETPGGWRLVDKSQNEGQGTFIGPVFKTGGAAEKWLAEQGYLNQKVRSIDITPAMRKSVLHEGQPIARTEEPKSEYALG